MKLILRSRERHHFKWFGFNMKIEEISKKDLSSKGRTKKRERCGDKIFDADS